jgi:hypothetical protein
MIDKKITLKSCMRKYAITDRDLMNRGGQLVPKGTKVYIVFASNWGLEIRLPKCECCGVSVTISHLKRNDLTLVESED